MNRRGFLGLLGGALAAGALKEVIPFNRVWSFPSKISFLEPSGVQLYNTIDYDEYAGLDAIYTKESLDVLANNLVFDDLVTFEGDLQIYKIGQPITIRTPPRYHTWNTEAA